MPSGLNIPNLLTLLRIILVPVVVILLMQELFLDALIVCVIAGITDGLDGFLARKLNQMTPLGAYLDPLADKALLTTSFVTLAILGAIPGWLAVVVLSRDFIILFGVSIMFLMSIPFVVAPSFVSKITTCCQFALVCVVLVYLSFAGANEWRVLSFLCWLTATATIVSGLHYIYKGVCYINSAEK